MDPDAGVFKGREGPKRPGKTGGPRGIRYAGGVLMNQSVPIGHKARLYGLRAERLTLWLFWLKGWERVAWREKVGRFELDLILVRGDELRLIEVKARRSGAWSGADTALGHAQRLRLQKGLRHWLDRVPWPGQVSFQRVSWAGWRVRCHPPERWQSLSVAGPEPR